MAKSAALKKTESSSAQEFEPRIRDARYSVGEDRFIVTFDSGKEYAFPRSALEVDDGSDLVKIQLDRGRFFFRVTQVSLGSRAPRNRAFICVFSRACGPIKNKR
jgi:hypothetical protein